MSFRLLILMVVSGVALHAADEVPLFNATLSQGREQRFVLVSSGKTSGWLKLGDTFDGYKINVFDAKGAALEVERDGRMLRLPLVPDGPVKPVELSDRQMLETLAAKIQPTGFVIKTGGELMPVFDRKGPVVLGSKIVIRHEGEDYELELIAADRANFTVRYRGQELTRPLRSPEPKR